MNERLNHGLRRLRNAALGVVGLTSLLLAAPAEADVSVYFDLPYAVGPYWGYYPPPRYYGPPPYYRYRPYRPYRPYGYRHGYRGRWKRPHRGYGRPHRRLGPGRGHGGRRSQGRGGRGGRGGGHRR